MRQRDRCYHGRTGGWHAAPLGHAGAVDTSSGGDIELGAPRAPSGASDINDLKLSGTGPARALKSMNKIRVK